ncbi:hypothetical protein [Foetidibacter luteolus]|uniref:hypothetical protein n=1 Tax=Foetidibacter luteolus TaxID=2608880 RepID=UPI00129B7B75|nr:hypothetical protein [Foetidibacter luteolus]
MTNPELLKNIKAAVKNSGYSLEQKAGHLLQKRGWIPFYSTNYIDPSFGKERELDILAYKIINQRRVELRISCKRSNTKPWILFTEDSSRYVEHSSILKITPVVSNQHQKRKILYALRPLPFFSHKRRAINYTSFTKAEFNNEARSLIKDGIFSALNSIYHRIFPGQLLFDTRGTIYFFITLFEGNLFESYYDPSLDDDVVNEIDYGIYDTRLTLLTERQTISNEHGAPVQLSDVMYWFSDWFRLEIITWKAFDNYLSTLDKTFNEISQEDITCFGKSWSEENFPKIIGEAPKI